MRVLIACEFSGIVRDAFALLGHDAWSCDLLQCERGGKHLQGDVLGKEFGATKADHWDLMIAHPPCTYLCNSGVRWLYNKDGSRNAERWQKMIEACGFFNAMLRAPIKRIAVENPIMHKHARERLAKMHSQIIQPWQFGHGEIKATCLWLKGLPLLRPTQIVDGRVPRVHHASPNADRWKERSRTLPGVAAAMAQQWGDPAVGAKLTDHDWMIEELIEEVTK